jgi:hypothetical protein
MRARSAEAGGCRLRLVPNPIPSLSAGAPPRRLRGSRAKSGVAVASRGGDREMRVWARDEGRRAFVGPAWRCAERGFLEFHQVVPFADGGATEAENLQLRCRAHNAFEAEAWFGPLVARERSPVYAAEATRSRPSTTLLDRQVDSGI